LGLGLLMVCQVISQLQTVMMEDTLTQRFDRELWQQQLSPLLNLWKQLMQVSDETDTLQLMWSRVMIY